MDGVKKFTRKMGFGNSQGQLFGGSVDRAKYRDGIGLCGHYDTELDAGGFCRDDDCRHERLVKALKEGRAMKVGDTIVWNTAMEPGVKKEGE